MAEVMSSTDEARGGIFVVNPVSFGMCCHQGKFILFDRHAQGNAGALLAVVPSTQAVEYLSSSFFSHPYPFLSFNVDSGNNLAAHMTFLSLLHACV